MADQTIWNAYNKYAPRWFKVIRWRGFAERTMKLAPVNIVCFIAPMVYSTYFAINPYPLLLCIYQPQTEEERLALKRDTMVMDPQRDWQIGQYNHGRPPTIDVWKRRKEYPEHYGTKYDIYERDGVVTPSKGDGSVKIVN